MRLNKITAGHCGDEVRREEGENNYSDTIHQGFSLLEVLIAIFVLSIGLLSLSSMQVYAIKGNGLARMSTQATYLAQHMLERIKNGDMVDDGTFGFIDMSVTSPGIVLDEDILPKRCQDGTTGGPFDVKWQVIANTNWSRRVMVSVSWYGGDRKRMVSLATITRGDGY